MPLPSDEKLIELSEELLRQFDALSGLHPGFRPAHAKGVLLTGFFTPSSDAASLTRAPHMAAGAPIPVIARFSDATGLPLVPDYDPNAEPRGLAIRFVLREHVHTDIISHSANGFPTRTGQEFLEFLRAVTETASAKASPTPIEVFLGNHPAARAFVQTPKPMPASFATEQYFGVTAYRFTNSRNVSRYGRYRIVPGSGIEHIDAAAASARGANFLFDEVAQRIAGGPVAFEVQVQLAEPQDAVEDATVAWPEDRPFVQMGRVELTAVMENNDHQQKTIIFDPIPRVDGIEASGDPLLELRAALYLLSGRRRRQTPAVQASTSA